MSRPRQGSTGRPQCPKSKRNMLIARFGRRSSCKPKPIWTTNRLARCCSIRRRRSSSAAASGRNRARSLPTALKSTRRNSAAAANAGSRIGGNKKGSHRTSRQHNDRKHRCGCPGWRRFPLQIPLASTPPEKRRISLGHKLSEQTSRRQLMPTAIHFARKRLN